MILDNNPHNICTLSIVVPCYNVQDYLPCLLEQFSKMEICDTVIEYIFIDDASVDKTMNIIRMFKDTNPTFNVTILYNKVNSGQSFTRNKGIDIAIGEYIWFLDSDDLFVESTLKEAIKILSEEAPEILLAGLYSFKHQEHYCHPEQIIERDIMSKEFFSFPPNEILYDSDRILYNYFKSVMMYPCCVIMHRNCIGDIRFPVGKKLEDVETMPKYISMAKSCYYLSSPIVYYRRRPKSTMTTGDTKTFIDFSRSMYNVTVFFENKQFSTKTCLEMFLCYSTLLRWSLNDIVKLELMSEEVWKEYQRSLDMFWNRLPYTRVQLFSTLIQSYSIKRILTSTVFLISPKLYAKLAKTFKSNKYN